MAEEQKIEGKPQPVSKPAPVIRVMPEEFRYGKIPPKPEAAPVVPPIPPSAKAPKPKRSPLLIIILVAAVGLGLGGGAYFVFLAPRTQAPPPPPANVNRAPSRNVNRPVNQNVNVPANANVNQNINQNVNAPVNVNAPFPLAPRPGRDSDADGLTDGEETLYGTDSTKPDSDGDGFLDGGEVFHLYNPAGIAPERLIDTGSVRTFTNSAFGYELYVPARWIIQQSDDRSVLFQTGTGEFFQVLVEDNPERQSVISWYLAQAPGVTARELQPFVVRSGADGIYSPDRLTAYIASNSHVFVIAENIGTLAELNYTRTFEMMLNSFRIIR
jgi:hypothetical protein